MVCLIPHIFSVFIVREGDPQLHQMIETSDGQSRFTQCQISVHTLSPEQILRQSADAVPLLSCQRQFVIGLLIGAGIAGSSRRHMLRQNSQVLLSVPVQPHGRMVAGRSRSHNHSTDFRFSH